MSTAEPTVSVIIRTYNRASKLRNAIYSVLAQTFHDWELIVVDNHSQDDTEEVVNSFNDDRIKLVKIHNNGIISASLNLGLSLSTGQFIAILDSDDWWSARKLELSLDPLWSGFDVVHHPMYTTFSITSISEDPKARPVQTNRALDPQNPYADLFWLGNGLSNSSVVLRKSRLLEIGGFTEEPNCLGAEDYHTWLSMARNGCTFFKLPQVLGYLIHDGQNLWSFSKQIKALSFIFSEFKFYANNSSRYPAWACYSLGRCYLALHDYASAVSMFIIGLRSPLPPIAYIRQESLYRLKAFMLLLQALRKWALSDK